MDAQQQAEEMHKALGALPGFVCLPIESYGFERGPRRHPHFIVVLPSGHMQCRAIETDHAGRTSLVITKL